MIMKTRHGKIARLPKEIQEQFHGRDQGAEFIAVARGWLCGLAAASTNPGANTKINNVKIKPWAIMASKWIKVYQGISKWIKGGGVLRVQGDF